MKRSTSDWDLEEFLRPIESPPLPPLPTPGAAIGDDGRRNPSAAPELQDGSSVGVENISLENVFGFSGRDAPSNHSPGSRLTGSQIWSQNLIPLHSSITSTIESQSSICAGSPISSFKTKGIENLAIGGTSGSEQSDEESLEIEAGACEQSTNTSDLKRMRRMVSNRESARRSRKRKQAHLADLELQVDQLKGENASLYKQLTGANQHFSEAVTDNRILKSDVEALRVKVKMAEDMVSRGSLTCGLDNLLQDTINPLHFLNTCQIPPIVELQADEGCYLGASVAAQVQNIGLEDGGIKNCNLRSQSPPLPGLTDLSNMHSRIREVSSCVTDFWPWDSNASVMSKQ